ncbi:MAG: hypothetical protein WC509_08535 [Candidatus Izemoplasmatales bacterium]
MIDVEMIKILREQTGAKIVDCKSALEEADGEGRRALELLKAKAIQSARKRRSRFTRNGIIAYYVHDNLSLGVLVEVCCETSTAASTRIFKDFARDVAMHIAAMKPRYVAENDVPSNEIESLRGDELHAFYGQSLLMNQAYYKDPTRCVQDVLLEVIARLRENVTIKRFVRFEADKSDE